MFRPSIAEQIQAESFSTMKPAAAFAIISSDINYLHHDVARLKVGDLITLAKRITGEGAATRAFQQFCMQNNVSLNENSGAKLTACGGALPSSIWPAPSARLPPAPC